MDTPFNRVEAQLEMQHDNDYLTHHFVTELDSWCFALSQVQDKLDRKTIHAVIREMSGLFLWAVVNSYSFNVKEVANKLLKYCKGIIEDKEMIFYIVANLPNPTNLSAAQILVMNVLIEEVSLKYPDVVDRFKKRLSTATASKNL